MIFIWRWPFFVRTLEQRLAKLAKAQESFEFHGALSRDLMAKKDARIARLAAQNTVHAQEVEQADTIAANFKALRTKRVLTMDHPNEGNV